MNILLNIPESIVGKYQSEADKEKRSRKNIMEKVLIEYFELATSKIEAHEQPKTNYTAIVPETPKVSLMDGYYARIKEAGNVDQIKEVVRDFKKDDTLSGWQKQALEKYAIETSRKLDF